MSKQRVAFITGATGQAAAYLSRLLLEKGYFVHGMKRRTSLINTERVDEIFTNPNFKLHYGDMTDGASLYRLITEIRPDEVYNLAAMSHVRVSFEIPEYTADATAMGTLRLLEAVRNSGRSDTIKTFQASSSEIFGLVQEVPQKETTPLYPRSPYGAAKAFAHYLAVNYRESYGMFICSGILFNYESPLRGETFVTRKITIAAAKIANGLQEKLFLGNLDAKRDWGHAKDYMKAAWLMLQHEKPEDYVIATGITTSVREFAFMAFKEAGIDIVFKNTGLSEIGVDAKTGKTIIEVDPVYFRPTEVDLLMGDSSKARRVLGWQPTYALADLIKEMVQSDLKRVRNEIK